MRSKATGNPPLRRTAAVKGAAKRFSYMISTAEATRSLREAASEARTPAPKGGAARML